MKKFFVVVMPIVLLLVFLFGLFAFFGNDVLFQIKQAFVKDLVGTNQNKKVIDRFAIISDTHADNFETEKAIKQIKTLGVDYLIDTGDWTTVGTLAEFENQKAIVDSLGLPYWGIMGDHDRWQSGSANFEQVFGKAYQSFDKNGLHHVLLDTSDTNNGFGKDQLDWFEEDMNAHKDKPTLIFMHLPIYHPTSDRTVSQKAGSSGERDAETQRFLSIVKGKNVLAMFAGDHHLSSHYTEPQTSVKIFISGAVTRERNLQTPRFTLVEIYSDMSLNVSDQIIN